MGVEMRSAVGNGVLRLDVTFQPLVQIAGGSNIDRDPTTVLGLPGIDVIPWRRLKSSVKGITLVLILGAGLPGPIDQEGSAALRLMMVMTE